MDATLRAETEKHFHAQADHNGRQLNALFREQVITNKQKNEGLVSVYRAWAILSLRDPYRFAPCHLARNQVGERDSFVAELGAQITAVCATARVAQPEPSAMRLKMDMLAQV